MPHQELIGEKGLSTALASIRATEVRPFLPEPFEHDHVVLARRSWMKMLTTLFIPNPILEERVQGDRTRFRQIFVRMTGGKWIRARTSNRFSMRIYRVLNDSKIDTGSSNMILFVEGQPAPTMEEMATGMSPPADQAVPVYSLTYAAMIMNN